MILLTTRHVHYQIGGSTIRTWVSLRATNNCIKTSTTIRSSSSLPQSATTTCGPILTFFSPNPQRSRSVAKLLNELFHLPIIHHHPLSCLVNSTRRDCLDELYFGKESSSSWDSIASACPTSGTILHFLSYNNSSVAKRKSSVSEDHVHHSPLHLIAIHGTNVPVEMENSNANNFNNEHNCRTEMILECRRRLTQSFKHMHIVQNSFASTLEAQLRGLVFRARCKLFMNNREPQSNWIFPTSLSTVPIFDFSPFSPNHAIYYYRQEHSIKEDEARCKNEVCTGKLRELALPFFPGALSLQTRLSRSSLSRPLPGLYQYSSGYDKTSMENKSTNIASSGLIVRPLPAAKEDLRLSPPTLVFQCPSLVDSQMKIEEHLGGRTFKIGWRGDGKLGSFIVSHPFLTGLDVRICEIAGTDWMLSSAFDESQDSLLAGSLAELQSVHVVSDGNHEGIPKANHNSKGDCWAEFRSNVRYPLPFLQGTGKTAVGSKTSRSTL